MCTNFTFNSLYDDLFLDQAINIVFSSIVHSAWLTGRHCKVHLPAAMTFDAATVPSIGEPTLHFSQPTPESPLPSPGSSAVASEDDIPHLASRPKLGSRKSSGTMIISREQANSAIDPEIEEGDVRTMSPRRNSEEVDKLGEDARRDLIEQAKVLQTSLQAIVDRVEEVKSEHEKLEGGNKFLQSYVNQSCS